MSFFVKKIGQTCHSLRMAEEDATSRFRPAKSIAEEITCVEKAVPKATTYKNQWALSVFREWQQKRDKKWPSFDFGGLFKAMITVLLHHNSTNNAVTSYAIFSCVTV